MKQVPCSKNFHMGLGIRILHPYVQQFNSELAPEKLPGPNIGSRIGKKPTTMNFQEKLTRWWFHLFFYFHPYLLLMVQKSQTTTWDVWNLVNNGRQTTNLNWWSPDFWTINSREERWLSYPVLKESTTSCKKYTPFHTNLLRREDVQIEVCLFPCHLVVVWSCAVQVGVPGERGKGRRNTLGWLPEKTLSHRIHGTVIFTYIYHTNIKCPKKNQPFM